MAGTATVRALSNESVLTCEGWSAREFRKGSVYEVPIPVARHLRDHGIVVVVDASSVDDQHFDQTPQTDAEIAAEIRKKLMGVIELEDDPPAPAPEPESVPEPAPVTEEVPGG